MKKLFRYVALSLFLISGFALGAEVVATVEPVKSPDWIIFAGHIAADILPVVGVIVASLVGILVKKLTAKYHLDGVINTQAIVDDAVKKGISYAEVWAEKQSGTPTGNEKMNTALAFIDQALKSQAVQTYERDHIQKLAEHFLTQQDAPAAPATPAA